MNSKLIALSLLFFFAFYGGYHLEAQAEPQLCYHGVSGELQNTSGTLLKITIEVRFNQPSYYIPASGGVAIASPTETVLTLTNQIPPGESFVYGGGESGPGFYSEFPFVIQVSAIAVFTGTPGTFTGTLTVQGSNYCIPLSTAQGMPAPSAPTAQPGLRTASLQGFIVPMGTDGRAAALPERSLDIWGIDQNGRGYLALRITAAELARLPEAPAQNVTVRENPRGVGFYVLTTGEYQVNFGPSPDGWVDVVVFTRDMHVTNVYRWNVNETR